MADKKKTRNRSKQIKKTKNGKSRKKSYRFQMKQPIRGAPIKWAHWFENGNGDGVDYDRINGAKCPRCRMRKAQVLNTLPWENDVRIRYHQCQRCGFGRFKSVETYH